MTTVRCFLIIFLVKIFLNTHAQSGQISGLARQAVLTAGNSITQGQYNYSWTVGDNIVFTAFQSELAVSQGFLQPMVCKRKPVIVALHQTGCSQPYTLDVGQGFHLYQWKSGTSVIATGTASLYYPVREGSYHVLVGDSTGCMLTASPVRVDLSGKNPIPVVVSFGNGVGSDTLLGVVDEAKDYQWFVIALDGVHRAIVGETGRYYRPYYNGIYYVRVNTFDHCTAYSAPFSFNNTQMDDMLRYQFEQTDSTILLRPQRKILTHRLHVFPVPAPADFHIDYESPENNILTLQLISSEGTVVHVKKVPNKTGKLTFTFKRGDLPVGAYLLRVQDGDYTQVQNVILE